MFPVSADKLSFLEIADYWSRRSAASQGELLAELESAWWRREITGNSARSRLELLKRMYQSRHELPFVVFVAPNDVGPPADIIPLPSGGVVVKPRINVPNQTDDWSEESCAPAFEELTCLPSHKYFKLFSYDICFIELTCDEFFGWVATRGFEIPTFWKHPKAMQASPQTVGPSNNSHSSPVLSKRLAEAKIEPEFKLWREKQQGGYIPTEAEDVAHMKQFGVSRARVRDLRKKSSRRKRGQKRSRQEAGKSAGN